MQYPGAGQVRNRWRRGKGMADIAFVVLATLLIGR
jgi:hypothetical protein